MVEPEKRPGTRGEHEYWSAEVRDPAREEKGGGATAKIVGLKGEGGGVEIVTGVIERHDNHDETTERVDGLHATFWRRRDFCAAVHRGFTFITSMLRSTWFPKILSGPAPRLNRGT